MHRGRVAPVSLEAVDGVVHGLPLHQGVTTDLRHTRRRRHSQRRGVTPDDRGDAPTQPEVVVGSVEEDSVGLVTLLGDLGESTGAGTTQRLGHAELVTLRVRGVTDPHGVRPRPDGVVGLSATSRIEILGVANPAKGPGPLRRRHDRADGDRARPRAAADLVDPADDRVAVAPAGVLDPKRRTRRCHDAKLATHRARAPDPRTVARGAADTMRRMERGSRVEVRSTYDNRFARGFEIVDVVGENGESPSYRVRRRSDGSVLPKLFPADDVRIDDRRNRMWWH